MLIDSNASFLSLDGVRALHNASWMIFDWLSVDRHGDLVVYEDWGGIDVERFVQSLYGGALVRSVSAKLFCEFLCHFVSVASEVHDQH